MGPDIAMLAAWLTMLLVPSCCVLQAPPDDNLPIRNLRMDPHSQRLTWDLSGNVTGIECIKNSRQKLKAREDRYCEYRVLSLCDPTNYTVRAASPPFSTWIVFPQPGGDSAAAAQNVTCKAAGGDALTCHWAVGRAAPPDVQYQLSWIDQGSSRWQACVHYRVDTWGRQVGCRVDGISQYCPELYVQVFGQTRASWIPCSSKVLTFSSLELLRPPNITTRCNETHSQLQWEMQSRFNCSFRYTLHIQKVKSCSKACLWSVCLHLGVWSGEHASYEKPPPCRRHGLMATMLLTLCALEPPMTDICSPIPRSPSFLIALKVLQDTNSFALLHRGAFMVKIKVEEVLSEASSDWSEPQHFACDSEEKKASSGIWQASLLMALGTLLALLLAVLLCRRFSVIQRVFPPIPRMRDPTRGHGQHEELVVWDLGPSGQEDCPVAQVQVQEES
ncbi:interleukin-3 receptor subunit alpha [Ochotona princeps]|uniref:interleukin-3 receptor subunit alpha n=1 Tax=Ochotona princeps TaxID=9978 RepID=UPI002714612B|nr:interleukin-3 receptor subunit alpha [Ochotona princeps]